MSNALYDFGRKAFGDAGVAWTTDTIKIALIDNAYSPNLSTDEFWSDISSHVVGTPQALASPTNSAGTLSGANTTFVAVATGHTVGYIAIYKDTGTPTTSRLIALIDTATGLPVTTNNGDITITWNGSGIIKL